MRIVMISDVHTKWHDLVIPDCDLLISAGDYSWRGEKTCVEAYHRWLSKQQAEYIISVQGNHELWVEKNWQEACGIVAEIDSSIRFVKEGPVELRGLEHVKLYCSAVTPEYGGWAWNVERGAKIKRHWDAIPDDTQILITHGPAYGIMDIAPEYGPENLGCPELLKRIRELKQLQLHVFGHIHSGSGMKTVDGVQYVNASICDERYQPTNTVRYIELEIE